jgi:Spy/CpxP family protein refolding chaperone
MRLLIAILAVAAMIGVAYAQGVGGGMGGGGMGGGGRGGGKGRNAAQNTEQQKADQQKKKAAEDAYKSGLKAIPDAKDKFDPWRNSR